MKISELSKLLKMNMDIYGDIEVKVVDTSVKDDETKPLQTVHVFTDVDNKKFIFVH